ncbi:MAG: hypothetical protein ACXWNQ_03525 [Anaerolineales bacterium]
MADIDSVLTGLIETGTSPPLVRQVKKAGKRLLRAGGHDALFAAAQLIAVRNCASSTRNMRVDLLQEAWTELAKCPPVITGFPPLVRVRDERKASIRRLRNAEFWQRMSDARRRRGDQLRFYQVPLLVSEIAVLVADLNIDHRAGRQQISDCDWRRLVGRAIAVAARQAIKK